MVIQKTVLSQDRPLRSHLLSFPRVKRKRLSPSKPGIVSKWIGPAASGMFCAAAPAWNPIVSWELSPCMDGRSSQRELQGCMLGRWDTAAWQSNCSASKCLIGVKKRDQHSNIRVGHGLLSSLPVLRCLYQKGIGSSHSRTHATPSQSLPSESYTESHRGSICCYPAYLPAIMAEFLCLVSFKRRLVLTPPKRCKCHIFCLSL